MKTAMQRSVIPLAPSHVMPHRPNPMPSFWQRAPTWKKGVYVGGAVAAVAGTVLLVQWVVRPKPFESISPQCNDFSLGNRREINSAIEPLVRDAARHGAPEPFTITREFLSTYAPSCRSYPEQVRNPGEAQLYVTAFMEVIRVMEEQALLSPEQKAYFYEMVSVWGKSQGLPSSVLPSKAPPMATVG